MRPRRRGAERPPRERAADRRRRRRGWAWVLLAASVARGFPRRDGGAAGAFRPEPSRRRPSAIFPAAGRICRRSGGERRASPADADGPPRGGMIADAGPRPLDGSRHWPQRFPAKERCSRCGLCETSLVRHVTDACAFWGPAMARIDAGEARVHGRGRAPVGPAEEEPGAAADGADEGRFGVLHRPVLLAQGVGLVPDAQWTGVVTGIAASMLEAGIVDAVACVAAASTDPSNRNATASSWCTPEPVLARTVADVLRGRGVKPALAPSLKVLEEIQADPSVRSVLFCGVGCAVQALRAVQSRLNLTHLYVLGTNCADNSPTPQAAERFVAQAFPDAGNQQRPLGYEFMPDFRVHLKTDRGAYLTKPYFSLPENLAGPSIAPSCLACFDYTNALADVVVGYMGAPRPSVSGSYRMNDPRTAWQTLTIRNQQGSRMVQVALDSGRIRAKPMEPPPPPPTTGAASSALASVRDHRAWAVATLTSDPIVKSMLGQPVADAGMPVWLGELMADVLSRWAAPQGLDFARYSIDYHFLRNYLCTLREKGPAMARISMPQFAVEIVDRYLATQPSVARLAHQVELLWERTRKRQ